jgi:hypothetical protein
MQEKNSINSIPVTTINLKRCFNLFSIVTLHSRRVVPAVSKVIKMHYIRFQLRILKTVSGSSERRIKRQ